MSAPLRQLLWYLIAGTRGGWNRVRIIETVRARPSNAHQLAEVLRVDYRTVRHHLEILVANGILTRPAGDVYASTYFLSPYFESNYGLFEEICRKAFGGRPRERREA